MRILEVNKFHYLRGGSERYYFDITSALRRRGHEVDHLSMRHPRNVPAGPRDEFVDEVDYRANMGWAAKIAAASRAIHNRAAASAARRLALAGPRPVAHLHNIAHQLSTSIVSALHRAGVPMAQTLHDYKLVCPNSQMLTGGAVCDRCRGGKYWSAVRHACLLDSRSASAVAAAEAYLCHWLRTYDRVGTFVCPSRFMLETVASFGVNRDRLAHVPHFLPLGEYPLAGPPRELACVYLGRLAREKGIGTLIEAITRMRDKRLELWVLGEGPLRESLEAKAQASCPGRVKFLGYRSGTELAETVRSAAMVATPSEWYENQPYSVLEAFAYGRPVVGARIGGIPELVEDQVTGRLHVSGDPDSLAEALDWMLADEARLAALGAAARAKVEREHSEAAHLDRLEVIFARLLEG